MTASSGDVLNAFPTTGRAFDTTANGGDDAFVTKLNATGTAPLVYSTYLGVAAPTGAAPPASETTSVA